jgi:hypothetical protein
MPTVHRVEVGDWAGAPTFGASVPSREERELAEIRGRRRVSEQQLAEIAEVVTRDETLPMRPLEESTRLIKESYEREQKAARAYLDELYTSGRELAAVKAGETYGEREYFSFDKYCEVELPYNQGAARRRILFFEVTEASRRAGVQEPTSLKQIRALQRVHPDERATRWIELVSDEVEVTTRSIQSSVAPGGDEREEEIERLERIHRMEQEAAKKEQEAATRELDRVREQLDLERKQLDDRTDEIERQFVEEMARIKAHYGDEEEPTFAEIPPEAWAEALRNAKSQRVMDVMKHLNDLYTWPEWMGAYFPDEAVEAIMDMERRDALVEAFRFIVDWMSRVVDGVEERNV